MARDTWIILGASSSIARGFAHEAAAQGSAILLAGRDEDDLQRSASDLKIRYDVPVDVLPFDAAQLDRHQDFVSACRERAERVNLFLVFGVMHDQERVEDDTDLLLDTIETNYTGAAALLNRFHPVLAEQAGGQVVVLSSVSGDRGRFSNYAYGSAKAGLNAYLQGYRARLFRHGATVTTVKAGFMDTAMTFGLPGLFLVASPQAAGRAILKAATAGKEVIYFPWFWRWIMLIIRLVPERIFKRLSI